MKNKNYVAPVIDNITVELEQGIAASVADAGYGGSGQAGSGGTESGSTQW